LTLLQTLMEKAYNQNDLPERPLTKPSIHVTAKDGRKVKANPNFYFRNSKLVVYVAEEQPDAIRLLKEQGINVLSFPEPRSIEDCLHVVEETIQWFYHLFLVAAETGGAY